MADQQSAFPDVSGMGFWICRHFVLRAGDECQLHHQTAGATVPPLPPSLKLSNPFWKENKNHE